MQLLYIFLPCVQKQTLQNSNKNFAIKIFKRLFDLERFDKTTSAAIKKSGVFSKIAEDIASANTWICSFSIKAGPFDDSHMCQVHIIFKLSIP